jgi:hypothetical protein
MADTVAIVQPDEALQVAVSEGTIVLSNTNLANPAVVESMSNIADVDVTTNGKVTGSILIYRETTQKWTASTTLDAQNMEGGYY